MGLTACARTSAQASHLAPHGHGGVQAPSPRTGQRDSPAVEAAHPGQDAGRGRVPGEDGECSSLPLHPRRAVGF